MNYYYITGTSRGIGKALAERLLEDDSNTVFGISRNCTIDHPNYKHYVLDLNDIDSLTDFHFTEHPDAKSIVLVNNSGVLGAVNQTGSLDNSKIQSGYNINTISPAILTNKFIEAYQKVDAKRIVLNTSSGAAKYVIQSWAVYCSSKAALDMFARVTDEEQKANFPDNPVRIFSVAPGIIDTQMQDEIREYSSEEFGDVQRFIDYKEQGELVSPAEVAIGYVNIFENAEKLENPILDLREM